MFQHINMILIVLISVVALLVIFFMFKKDVEPENATEEDPFSLPYLCEKIKEILNDNINQNILELGLKRSETKKREELKAKLNKAIRSCSQGNHGERDYMLDYLKDILQNQLNVNESTINNIIPFHNSELLTGQDKYEILLHTYKFKLGYKAFGELNTLCNFEKEKINEFGVHYEVDDNDINDYYEKFAKPLPYILKLQIVTQRIFQTLYGFSIADETFYQEAVDGISGGVSGITTEQYNYMEEILKTQDLSSSKAYNSLWVFVHGKPIHFSFMGFGSRNELIRVCKNLYLYDNVGQLTSTNGYKHSYLQNGSRVIVTRPKMTSGWSFFIRNFSSTKALTIDKLVTGKNNDIAIEVSMWVVKGLLNIIISGDQNSGKTTFLKTLFRFIDQRYPIRTTEAEYELWINNLYTHLNAVNFRGTEEVSLVDAINVQLKTDGAILILGEISDTPQANAFVTLTQRGTKMTMGTLHCVSSDDVIDFLRNAVLSKDGNFTNEMKAEEQVASGVHIDIHWEKASDGQRYITYINEIIPLPREDHWTGDDHKDTAEALRRLARMRAFKIREIVAFEHGEYVFKNSLSARSVNKIMKNLSKEDQEKFITFNLKALNT